MSYEGIHLISTVAVAFIGGVLGAFLILTMRESRTALAFGVASLFTAVWGIFTVLFHLAGDPEVAAPFAHISLIALVMQTALFFGFVTYFVERPMFTRQLTIFRLGVVGAALALSGFILFGLLTKTTFVISSVAEDLLSFHLWPMAGPLFIYIIYFLAGVYAFSTFILFRAFTTRIGHEQEVIGRILIATVIGLFALGINTFLWYGIPFFPIGNILLPIQYILIFLVVVDRRLLNTKVIATELIMLTVLVLLFGRVFLTQNLEERLMDVSIVTFVSIFGIFLIKGFLEEVSQRNKLEEVMSKLKDLNDHLQEKVEEQTTEIKRAYETEKKAREDLEVLDKSKSQFLLMTQHHLRTPLTIIKGYLSVLLSSEKFALVPEARESLGKITESTDKMARLINEMLDLTQFEIGKDILHREPIHMQSFISDMCEKLKAEITKKGLAFSLTFSPEAREVTSDIDHEKMYAALSNVIDNAVKYTRAGSVTVVCDVLTHPIEKTKQFRLTVSDSGIGIVPEELKRMFQRFFERGKDAERMNATGRGIGLVLTKQIIEAHGGRIWAESGGEGKGSVFHIEIPIRKHE